MLRTTPSRLPHLLLAAAVAVAVVPWIGVGAAHAEATTVAASGAGPAATVTVSSTANLGNQAVTVSWAGFRPSSAQQLQNGGDTYDTSTLNPVRVYECRGTAPVSSSDCYGSPGFSGVPASATTPAVPAVPGFKYPGQADPYANQPDGPSNWQDVATAQDGTGQVTVQLFTRREAPSLGCDATVPCSVVVVPNYGTDTGAGAVEDELDAPWAWDRRTVVPLQFLPLSDTCPLSGTSLGVEGSPSSARALTSWRAAACTAASPVTLDYTSIGEPQTRDDVTGGLSDVGLVTRPLAAGVPFAYAPVALAAVTVGFQVDDLEGRPVPHMNLDARLVAKLITASYRVADDANVVGNPPSLFRDPEFRALNPGVDWPGGSPGNHVLLLGDLSDATWALTSWIASDPTARAFLDGTADPYGMHVNLAYKGLALPFATFPLLDPVQQDTFQPVQGLDHVAQQLSLAQFPGAITSYDNGVAVVTKPSRQPVGRRETLGIIDTADAAAFRIPMASLLNPAGQYVAPDPTSIAAAAQELSFDPSGCVAPLHLSSATAGAYPLTLPVQAAVPTSADAQTRQAVLRFLDYALGPGQLPGDTLGALPAGYFPLTAALQAQAQSARRAVATVPPAVVPTPSPPAAAPTPLPTTGPVAAPAAAPPTSARPQPSTPAFLQPPVLAAPAPAPLPRLLSGLEPADGGGVLPLVLLVGLGVLVAGPVTLVLTRRAGPGSWWTR